MPPVLSYSPHASASFIIRTTIIRTTVLQNYPILSKLSDAVICLASGKYPALRVPPSESVTSPFSMPSVQAILSVFFGVTRSTSAFITPQRYSRPPNKVSSGTAALTSSIQSRIESLESHLPHGVNATLLVERAPSLLDLPPEEAAKRLDAHVRLGKTERSRHDEVLGLVRSWLEFSSASTVCLVDVALAKLPGTETIKKRSRKIDILAMNSPQGIVRPVEITVVRDRALHDRIQEKLHKYSDLRVALEASEWAKSRQLKVHAPVVIAVGVLGTVPAATREALLEMGVADEGNADHLLELLVNAVLSHNLEPFLPCPVKGRPTRAAYLKSRQRAGI